MGGRADGNECRREAHGTGLWMVVYPTAGGVGALSETKPHVLCVPSQNGFFDDWPQRHNATAGLFGGIWNSTPRESTNLKGPSMTKGPFGACES